MNVSEFRLRLIAFSNYYGIPLQNLVVAGSNARLLNDIRTPRKNLTNETVVLSNTVVIFVPPENYQLLSKHITSTTKAKYCSITSDKLNIIIFQQASSLKINITENIKFLTKDTLIDYYQNVPNKFKEY